MTTEFSALRVLLTRNSAESEHFVDCVVTERLGPTHTFGEADRAVIARSSLKPIQVIPFVQSGAADAFSFDSQDVAFAAASHSTEQAHVDRTAAMLARIGFDESALECGPARPLVPAESDRLVAAGEPFRPIHNCCSGKHAGFLAIARHLGIDHVGYIEADHPVQRLVTSAIEAFTGADLSGQEHGIDGCGIPTHAIPLHQLATSMVRLGDPRPEDGIDTATAAAAERVVEALVPNAYWMSGEGRAEVELQKRTREPLISKIGAEGVFMASLPERGIGIALKARDGGRRGADLAMEAVLEHLGVLAPAGSVHNVKNSRGSIVGSMSVSWS